jgi:integrase
LHESCPSFAPITTRRVADIFDYAQARGLLPSDRANPADQRRLRHLLPGKRKAVHRAALAYDAVPEFIAELRAIPSSDRRFMAARALELTILTALRVGEAVNARWSEMMKANREHQVPLSMRALEIVDELRGGRDGHDFVFPAPRSCRAIEGARLRLLLQSLRPA